MATGTWGGASDFKIYRATISWLQSGSIMQTGFYLRGASLEITNPSDAADSVLDWVNTSFRTILMSSDRINGVDVVNIVSGESSARSPANMVGSLTSTATDWVPGFVACVISMKSGLRKRYGQGRMFWPVRSETAITSDQLSDLYITSYTGLMDALAQKFIGNSLTGYNLVNVHGTIPPRAATPSRPARAEIPPTWYDVDSLRLNRILTALRSRKVNRGS